MTDEWNNNKLGTDVVTGETEQWLDQSLSS